MMEQVTTEELLFRIWQTFPTVLEDNKLHKNIELLSELVEPCRLMEWLNQKYPKVYVQIKSFYDAENRQRNKYNEYVNKNKV